MFDPAIDMVFRFAGHHPERITLGTALLATVAHLDGSGASTFLIVIPAMLPLYDKLGMDRRILACIVAMAAGVANMLPWGGPTLRAAASLDIPLIELYRPLIPIQIVGLGMVYLIAYYLGKRQAVSAPVLEGDLVEISATPDSETDNEKQLRRPGLFYWNLLLTLVVIVTLVSGVAAPVIVFMLGLIAALLINYRDAKIQRERFDAHAPSAMLMASILIAAGVFTGIMRESGMLTAMATWGPKVYPAALRR